MEILNSRISSGWLLHDGVGWAGVKVPLHVAKVTRTKLGAPRTEVSIGLTRLEHDIDSVTAITAHSEKS